MSVAASPSPCCLPDAVWKRANAWGLRVARDLGVVDPEEAADLRLRVVESVWLSWPCPHHEEKCSTTTPPPMAEGPRRRVREALRDLRNGRGDERAVLDHLRDAMGDVHRRRAAGAPYTSRVTRFLADVVVDALERAVAVVLIDGVQAHHSAEAARWALGGAANDAALYVAEKAARKRRVGDAGLHVLVSEPVSSLAPLAVTSRDVLRRAHPDRWAALQDAARRILTTSTTAEDGTELADVVVAEGLGTASPFAAPETAAEHRLCRVLGEGLDIAATEKDLHDLLDRAHRLPVDPEARATRIRELRPLWRAYQRSRRRWGS